MLYMSRVMVGQWRWHTSLSFGCGELMEFISRTGCHRWVFQDVVEGVAHTEVRAAPVLCKPIPGISMLATGGGSIRDHSNHIVHFCSPCYSLFYAANIAVISAHHHRGSRTLKTIIHSERKDARVYRCSSNCGKLSTHPILRSWVD